MARMIARLLVVVFGFSFGYEMLRKPASRRRSVKRLATEAYLLAEDSITAWMEECCQRDVNAFAAQAELFRSWKAWAETAGEHVGSQKMLMQKLEVRGYADPQNDG